MPIGRPAGSAIPCPLSTQVITATVPAIRAVEYPITRLHGYLLDRRRLDEVTSLLAGAPTSSRTAIPGLNSDRSDSIVGGALLRECDEQPAMRVSKASEPVKRH